MGFTGPSSAAASIFNENMADVDFLSNQPKTNNISLESRRVTRGELLLVKFKPLLRGAGGRATLGRSLPCCPNNGR